MLGAGIEPAHSEEYRILSPVRLPIPPPEHFEKYTRILRQFQRQKQNFLVRYNLYATIQTLAERKKMEQYSWVFWSILGVLFIIAEIFTLGFVLFWFGIAAFAALVVSLFGFGFLTQFLVFAGVSIICTLLSRKIFASKYNLTTDIRTGIDSLPGQVGTVTISGKGTLGEGAVKVYGSVWTAFPEDDEMLVKGDKVEVTRIAGSSIYVRKYKELPEWRDSE